MVETAAIDVVETEPVADVVEVADVAESVEAVETAAASDAVDVAVVVDASVGTPAERVEERGADAAPEDGVLAESDPDRESESESEPKPRSESAPEASADESAKASSAVDADAEAAETAAEAEAAETAAEADAAEGTQDTGTQDTEAQDTGTQDTAPEAPAATPAKPMAVALHGVTKSFGDTHAVDGIDLEVPAGSFYGIVGPNGAGKTTTLSIMAGLLKPDSGAVSIGGIDALAEPDKAKRLMGILPDRLRTFDRLTGRQLLYYFGILRGLEPAVVESRSADLARAFDLSDSLGRVVADFSVGMTKKLLLAGALIHSPRVLVLDEPFESVDPTSSAVILDILGTYVEHGGTVVLSSHGMELVERVCSRVAVIVSGQVLAEGTIDEVRGGLTLEERFVELSGGLSDVEGLEWLHTFSD
ncbi:MAG TPA: ABC transporter ATP-binding protein [Microbacteriaceae bacterium]|nr:ABC transporter ATP-binding protein [Microbacteriaceae bacterium]